MSELIRIIAAVVDTQRLTLYKESGETIVIAQGDPRIRPLVDKVVPAIEAQQYCDLAPEDLSQTSHYNEVQNSMGGMLQFFRMMKEQMDAFFTQFGQAPAPVEAKAVGAVPETAAQSAVAEIMSQAIPVTSSDFHKPMTDQETVVAVMDTGEMIAGVEKLDSQLQAIAAKLGSLEGVKNFFRRMATVKRNHTVQDLLTFMQKGELPIADDGSVLVYKRLNSTNEEGVFVDCHSGKVKQRVGSKVFMDEKLVDPNRSQDCSSGLHVARRDYLNGFHGNVCVLAKLAPEDVIAVPHRDARKLRAKGYHIIARLSQEDASLVCNNKPMKDTVLLGNAVSGNHAGILETVEITGHMGEGVIITPVAEASEIELDTAKQATSLDELPVNQKKTSTVDATKVAKEVSERKSRRQQQAETLLNAILQSSVMKVKIQKAKELLAFKKTAKVSWDKLGISEDQVQAITTIANGDARLIDPVVKAPAIKKAKAANKAASKPIEQVVTERVGTPRERIRKLINDGIKANASNIVSIKKAAKKSWSALGVTEAEEKQILSAA